MYFGLFMCEFPRFMKFIFNKKLSIFSLRFIFNKKFIVSSRKFSTEKEERRFSFVFSFIGRVRIFGVKMCDYKYGQSVKIKNERGTKVQAKKCPKKVSSVKINR